jgi:Zn-dependent protease with chaperone function
MVAMIFLPGLYLCLLLSAVLSIAGAGLILLFFGWIASVTNRIFVGVMVFVAIGGLYGVWISISAGWRAIQRATVRAHAVRIQPQQAPALWSVLQDLSARMQFPLPQNVILEFATNFYVTEVKVLSFDGELGGRTLCISAPLLHVLDVNELRAILAHEFGHFTGSDTIYSRRFYPVYRGTQSALQRMSSAAQGSMSLPLLLPIYLLLGYLKLFQKVERKISRERELRADGVAAQFVGRDAIASGLKKVYAFSPLWSQNSEKWIVQGLNDGKAFVNLSRTFVEHFAPERALLNQLVQQAEHTLTHPTDSHPGLADRLAALGAPPDFGDPVPTAGATAADLIAAMEELERHLTDLETSLVAKFNPAVDKKKLAPPAAPQAPPTPLQPTPPQH